MSFLLDTDICSAHLKGDQAVWQKMQQHGGQLHVSVITVGELYTWTSRKGVSAKRQTSLREMFRDIRIVEVTRAIGEEFGRLRASFFDAGRTPPDMDLLIAATALVSDFTLVTHNVQDYQFIDKLRIHDWIA